MEKFEDEWPYHQMTVSQADREGVTLDFERVTLDFLPFSATAPADGVRRRRGIYRWIELDEGFRTVYVTSRGSQRGRVNPAVSADPPGRELP